MTEITRDELTTKYPLISEEIGKVLLWWRGDLHKFEVPNSDSRADAETMWATHADVYDRLSYRKKPGVSISDGDMRVRNRQLFNMLKDEFGWKEDVEESYPDPDKIF